MAEIGLKTPPSGIASNMDEAIGVLDHIGKFPVIIRPAFTLGGTGGGIAYNMDEYKEIIDQGLTASVTSQVLHKLLLLSCINVHCIRTRLLTIKCLTKHP